MFVKNGCPSGKVRRQLNAKKRRDRLDEDKVFLRIPFVPELEKDFRWLARRLKIRLRYTRGRSLGSMVSGAKLDQVEDLERRARYV